VISGAIKQSEQIVKNRLIKTNLEYFKLIHLYDLKIIAIVEKTELVIS
jgi:hypothetical protein